MGSANPEPNRTEAGTWEADETAKEKLLVALADEELSPSYAENVARYVDALSQRAEKPIVEYNGEEIAGFFEALADELAHNTVKSYRGTATRLADLETVETAYKAADVSPDGRYAANEETDNNGLHRQDRRIEKQLDLLETEVESGELDEGDAYKFKLLKARLEANRKPATIHNYLSSLRMVAKRLDIPLGEADNDELDFLMGELRDGTHPDTPDGGLSPNTLLSYQIALRTFGKQVDVEYDPERVNVEDTEPTKVTEDDIYSPDQIDAMLDAPGVTPRERALVALLLATGQRIGAVASIRYGDVDFTTRAGHIRLNDNAEGLKGADGTRPLLWAKPYVHDYHKVHPTKEDDDYLFTPTKRNGPSKPGDMLSYPGFAYLLQSVAEKAGIKKAVRPHLFRHTAISRMVLDGLSDQKIKAMAGWGKDSSQIERYSHFKDDEMRESIAEHYGLADSTRKVGQPSLDDCPNCGAPLRESSRFCPSCGLPLSEDAENYEQETQDTFYEDKAEAEGSEEDALDELRELVNENPELLNKLMDD